MFVFLSLAKLRRSRRGCFPLRLKLFCLKAQLLFTPCVLWPAMLCQ